MWLKSNGATPAKPALMNTGGERKKYKEDHYSNDAKEIHLPGQPFWGGFDLLRFATR